MRATDEEKKYQSKSIMRKKNIVDECDEIISQLDKNLTAKKGELQQELEKSYNPIIIKLYQNANSMPGGIAGISLVKAFLPLMVSYQHPQSKRLVKPI